MPSPEFVPPSHAQLVWLAVAAAAGLMFGLVGAIFAGLTDDSTQVLWTLVGAWGLLGIVSAGLLARSYRNRSLIISRALVITMRLETFQAMNGGPEIPLSQADIGQTAQRLAEVTGLRDALIASHDVELAERLNNVAQTLGRASGAGIQRREGAR